MAGQDDRSGNEQDRDVTFMTWPLRALTRLVLAWPVFFLTLALALAAAALFFTATDLTLKTSRLDLINPKSEFNQLWLDYLEEFGDADDLVIVAECTNPEKVIPVLDDVGAELKKYPDLFRSVLDCVDTTPLVRKGLHFITNPDDLKQLEHFTQEGVAVFAGHNNSLTPDLFLAGICQKLQIAGQQRNVSGSPVSVHLLAPFVSFTASLNEALGPQPDFEISPLPPLPGPGMKQREYFTADEGRLGVVLLQIGESKEGSFTYGTESITKLREIIAQVRARHADVSLGLTGLTVMENDEMRLSQDASTKATILSLIGVAIIFIAAFGGVRHPIIAVFALAVGFAWTMGYIVFSTGHLNILSMSFGVILIGLGIDFGIHYISKYLELRAEQHTPEEAILTTARQVGPGIFIGALTTSAAFVTVGLSEFTGIAELGIISAGGILLCCLAALIVIPACLILVDGRYPQWSCPVPVNLHAAVLPMFRFPKMVLFGCLLFACWCGFGLPQLWYDHNLLNMQPEGLESVELEHKLLTKWDKGAWFALSLANSPEELLTRKKAFESDPTLKVDEIVSRIPPVSAENQAVILRIGTALQSLPEHVASSLPAPQVAPLLATLTTAIQTARTLPLSLCSEPEKAELVRTLLQCRSNLQTMPEPQAIQRLKTFEGRLSAELFSRLNAVRLAACPEPPCLDDLPDALVSRYVGAKSGKLLMRVYSTEDIWNMDQLREFITKVKQVDPKATGNPIQTYEASLQMQRSYQQAAVLSLVIIGFLVWLDFRSVYLTLLVLVPLVTGGILAFGLMGRLGIALNPANTIAIPLILGIGVDDGVHLVHNFRSQRGAYRLPASLAASVIFTTLTTVLGFGTLMIADHRGLQSLGRVLVIGVSACTFAALVILPAFFTLTHPINSKKEQS
ncbi:MAG: MMPL family transporter [Planctomycetia bacterium]|nr:MMPL family transporter [Planctomycetia bacterium]